MSDENLGRFLKVQYRRAREAFNEEPVIEEKLATLCQPLIEEPRIPLRWRVTIHMMLAHISESPKDEIDLALSYLDTMEEWADGGQMSTEEEKKTRDYVEIIRPDLLNLRETLVGKASTSSVQEEEVATPAAISEEFDFSKMRIYTPEELAASSAPQEQSSGSGLKNEYIPTPPPSSPIVRGSVSPAIRSSPPDVSSSTPANDTEGYDHYAHAHPRRPDSPPPRRVYSHAVHPDAMFVERDETQDASDSQDDGNIEGDKDEEMLK